MPEALTSAPGRPVRQVYCLCAEWCGVCREWRATFDTLAAAHPQHRFEWVDVDAHEAVLDAVEIETFPVVLIAEQGRVLFFGAVEPSGGVLARLLERVERPAQPAGDAARRLLDVLVAACP